MPISSLRKNMENLAASSFGPKRPMHPSPHPSVGRTAKNPKPKEHPFAGPPNLDGEKRTLTLRLPAVKGIPLPSPGLIHNWDIDTEKPIPCPFYCGWDLDVAC